MVGIKKVVHELKNLPNSSPKISEDTELSNISEDTELSNQDNSQVSLLDLGTGTSVDSAPENQTATECITEDNTADPGTNTTEDSGKDNTET